MAAWGVATTSGTGHRGPGDGCGGRGSHELVVLGAMSRGRTRTRFRSAFIRRRHRPAPRWPIATTPADAPRRNMRLMHPCMPLLASLSECRCLRGRSAAIVLACAGLRLRVGCGVSSVNRCGTPSVQLLGPDGFKMREFGTAAASAPTIWPKQKLAQNRYGGAPGACFSFCQAVFIF